MKKAGVFCLLTSTIFFGLFVWTMSRVTDEELHENFSVQLFLLVAALTLAVIGTACFLFREGNELSPWEEKKDEERRLRRQNPSKPMQSFASDQGPAEDDPPSLYPVFPPDWPGYFL